MFEIRISWYHINVHIYLLLKYLSANKFSLHHLSTKIFCDEGLKNRSNITHDQSPLSPPFFYRYFKVKFTTFINSDEEKFWLKIIKFCTNAYFFWCSGKLKKKVLFNVYIFISHAIPKQIHIVCDGLNRYSLVIITIKSDNKRKKI